MKLSNRESLVAAGLAVAPPRRVAAYLRVSTLRQAEGDVSIPSQRNQIEAFCQARGWTVTQEFIDAGASGTNPARGELNRMLDLACGPERPFDAVVVYAYSRLYRDLIGMETAVKRLNKVGVELVSATQPSGNEPAEQLVRQVLAILDQHTSVENSKNTSRAMRENAEQGFWNGSTPPLGYKAVEAERRGSKIKKVLVVDEVEADTVRLIYRLYAHGDAASGLPPMGVTALASWLNSQGFQTRKGKQFGVGPLHKILTNPIYIGQGRYSIRNSATGGKHEPDQVVHYDVPPIIETTEFEAVQQKLATNNPKVTPPRVVTGPVLLTGIATCGICGGGMTMSTGTSKSGKLYTYYACASRAQKGKSACPGIRVPMPYLDELILKAVEERILLPERLLELLELLLARRAEFASNVDARLLTLRTELEGVSKALSNLYRLAETGELAIDEELASRIQARRAEKTKLEAVIQRAVAQAAPSLPLDDEKLQRFCQLVRERLRCGEPVLSRNYLRSVVGRVIVSEKRVVIVGSTHALHRSITEGKFSANGVRGFEQEWRARRDSNS